MMKRVLCIWFPNGLQPIPGASAAPGRSQPGPNAAPRSVVGRASKPVSLREQSATNPAKSNRLAEDGLRSPSYEDEGFSPVATLRALAYWCQRFSPLVGLEEVAEGETPESLLLDITGCAHVFGGEEQLARQIAEELQQLGYLPRITIADTLGAAWAVAHFGVPSPAPRIIPAGTTAAVLRPLPVTALRLPVKVVETLCQLGILRIDQLLALPRASLPARLGPTVVQRLDQALGSATEILVPERPPTVIEEEWKSEFPLANRQLLERVIGGLLENVTLRLRGSGQGVRELVFRFDGAKDSASVSTESQSIPSPAAPLQLVLGLFQPTLSRTHLFNLVRMQLEQMVWRMPVAAVNVRVSATAPLDPLQHALFSEGEQRSGARHLAALVDRLSSRLGRQSVLRVSLVADAQPEEVCRYESLVEKPGTASRSTPASRRKRKPHSGTSPGDTSPRGASPRICDKTSATALNSDGRSGPQPVLSRVPKTSDAPRLRVQTAPHYSGCLQRPLRLSPHPSPAQVTAGYPHGPPVLLHWKGKALPIRRVWGPERIETGWWRGPPIRRDYYRIETDDGRQFWMFHRTRGDWFIQGSFG